MFKITVKGQYRRRTEDGKKPPKDYKEEFYISELFEKHAMLRIVRRMLIKARLLSKHEDFAEIHTCEDWGTESVKHDLKKLTKKELVDLKRHELLEYGAMAGVFIKGSKLGRPMELIETILKALEVGGDRLKINHEERVMGKDSINPIAKTMLKNEVPDTKGQEKDEFADLI